MHSGTENGPGAQNGRNVPQPRRAPSQSRLSGGRMPHDEVKRPRLQERSLQRLDPHVDLPRLCVELDPVGMLGQIVIEESLSVGDLIACIGHGDQDAGPGFPRAAGLPAIGRRRCDVHARRQLLLAPGTQRPAFNQYVRPDPSPGPPSVRTTRSSIRDPSSSQRSCLVSAKRRFDFTTRVQSS